MKISFVTYVHSHRITNLLQTIRFLKKREPHLSESEFIIVGQDKLPDLEGAIWNTKQINLNSPNYHKPRMCNLGIKNASHPIIALIDSDRILPENYFHSIACQLKPKQFITTESLDKILHECTDLEIETLQFEFRKEIRSQELELGIKNLFSGNTVFFQEDYWSAGGADEQFIGYGFADNDMTRTILAANNQPIYLDQRELHLYHDRKSVMNNQILEDDELILTTNALKYCLKWGIWSDRMDWMCYKVLRKIEQYPQEQQKQFYELRKPKMYL